MSLFSKTEQEVVFSSSLAGKITYQGEPASGAKLTRVCKWGDTVVASDSALVDGDGGFMLPTVKKTIELSSISQFVSVCDISVEYNSDSTTIWSISKDTKTENSELGGVPVNFRCELSDEEDAMNLDNALLLTRCKWDGVK